MDRGAWWAMVHRLLSMIFTLHSKSRTRQKRLTMRAVLTNIAIREREGFRFKMINKSMHV